MNENYLCPKCKGLLNVDEHLVFIIKTKSPRKGLIFLSPEIGNYKVIKHTSRYTNFIKSLQSHYPYKNM